MLTKKTKKKTKLVKYKPSKMKKITFFRLTVLFLFTLTFCINLSAQNDFNIRIEGLNENDTAVIIVQKSSEKYFKKFVAGNATKTNELTFNLSDGKWAIIIDAKGYSFPPATAFEIPENNSASIRLTSILNENYSYVWQDDDSYVGHATQSYISEPEKIVVLDKQIKVPNDYSSIELRNKYGIILSDEKEKWTIEDSYRIYKMFCSLPYGTFGEGSIVNPKTGENIRGIFELTTEEQYRDLTITNENGIRKGVFSQSAFNYATPQIVTIDGIKGKFYSKRLYHAVVNFVTDFANDEAVVDWIAQEKFGVRFMKSNQETEDLMNEDASNFQEFFKEEKLEILGMFEELPEGFHKQEGLKYLVRRINGQNNPVHPQAAAIAWTQNNNIEFMEKAFNGTDLSAIRRLILHEKTHFLWEYTFDDELKKDWIEIGGWFEDPTSPSGWSTSNTTEFVSPYGHDNNPNEDMAESVAFYLENPDKLKSVSMQKFEFIRDRIMHGTRYIAEIREDLTFKVYNLFPDYTFPGKVTKVEVDIVGKPEEDKQVTIRAKLHSNNPQIDGATHGYIRFASILGTIHDIQLSPENGNIDSVLIGTTTFSKYEKYGYWTMTSFRTWDAVGNMRYENTSTVGMKLYIENPMEDVTPPKWNNDLKMEIVEGKFSGNYDVRPDENGEQMQAVKVSYSYYDDIPLLRSLSRMIIPNSNNEGGEVYSRDIQSNQPFNAEHLLSNEPYSNKYFELYLGVRDYLQPGYYSITYSIASDIGRNGSQVFFVKDTSDFHISNDKKDELFKDIRDSIFVETKYPDYVKPEIDINNITVNAEPTNPISPDGETRVDISILARDLSDFIGKESGVFSINFVIRDPLGNEHSYQTGNSTMNHPQLKADAKPDNNSEWKIYNFDLLLPQGSPPGEWGISSATIMDRAGNMKRYSFIEYVRFDVIESEFELEEPLDAEIIDKRVNAQNVENIDVRISCKPGEGLNYVYTIYSLMGGNVIRGEGKMTGDEIFIQGINTQGVLDGIIKLTVQLTDSSSQLIATKTVEYTKDTQRPSAYYTRSNLQNQGSSNLDDIIFEIILEKSEVGGTYEFTIEDLTSNLKSTLDFDTVISGTINADLILLNNLNLTKYIDKVIKTGIQVTDTCYNLGEWVYNYYLVTADNVIQINTNTDSDGDGITDINDNRPTVYNPGQEITSTIDMPDNLTFKIYPNPMTNELNIETNNVGELSIYDLTGKLLININLSNKIEKIDVSKLVSGTYLIQFISNKTISSSKFTKY